MKLISEKITSADGLLIASPEFNHTIPGTLKNLIDWLSRLSPKPFNYGPFYKKPIAIFSLAPAQSGGARCQDDLKKVLSIFNPFILNQPEVQIGNHEKKCDPITGELID